MKKGIFENKEEEIFLAFSSDEVAQLFPIGKVFSSELLIETMEESREIARNDLFFLGGSNKNGSGRSHHSRGHKQSFRKNRGGSRICSHKHKVKNLTKGHQSPFVFYSQINHFPIPIFIPPSPNFNFFTKSKSLSTNSSTNSMLFIKHSFFI